MLRRWFNVPCGEVKVIKPFLLISSVGEVFVVSTGIDSFR